MSDQEWRWVYDPDRAHVVTGLPQAVVALAEKAAQDLVELAALGVDVTGIGKGPRHGGAGGMRELRLPPNGWMYVMALPRRKLIVVTRIVPPFEHL
ncbi:hypothetical protein IPZ58_17890 [Streptomyces roseoverticillatus]|uniref:hypothetical protein n=1 Tax=Streptomyces roseoverticillatus TaxID=66429 RepID=UPI001F2E3875|nr:hypothetical protein [Streptomyces roseoverticillatus]MCF3103438.1 hypothetical protein [Streptomyces roseoverticillatus]